MSEQAEPQGSRSPRKAISLVLAVLLMSWFAFPAAVAGWMEDRCSDGPFCAALQTTADAVEAASRSVGVAGTLEAARDGVRTVLGIDEY